MLIISGGADPKKIKPKYWLINEDENEDSKNFDKIKNGKNGDKKI